MLDQKKQTTFLNPIFDSIGQKTVELMKILLLTLLGLSSVIHLVIWYFFPNVLSFQSYCIAFMPVYATLMGSYVLLRQGKKKLSIHMFLLGMVITQMLVVVFLTGPAAYVFVSYTNVVLVAGLILGPLYGIIYTLIIVASISLYFYAARLGFVDTELLQNIEYGPELILLATIACFVFTSICVSYFILKMSALYQSILDEKEKSNITLKKLEKLQKNNEMRINQGNAIGGLGKHLVQMEQTQHFLQIASQEILRVLEGELVIILVSTLEGHMVRGFAVEEYHDVYEGFLGNVVQNPKKIWVEPSSDQPSIEFLRVLFSNHQHPDYDMSNIFGVRIFESDHSMGAILICSNKETAKQKNFLHAVASIVSSALCRENAEENLRQYQKMETLGLLAGGIAHDFNNLLMTIVGNTDLALRKTSQNSDVFRLLRQISWASNQATSLTHKLLSFSQKTYFSPEQINVNEVLKEMIPILQQVFVGSIQIDFCYSKAPAWILMDRKDFETALLNLVVNAKEAIGEQGNVRISVAMSGGKEREQVCVKVQDNGTGIAPEVLSKVFDPFFTTKSTGTGLGLTMVRSVIERAGGNLNVESTTNGSCFYLHFPLEYPDYAKEKISFAEKKILRVVETIPKKILVVEDNPLVRLALVEMLEEGGYTALEADSGKTAFQKISEEEVDMVLSDMHMPGKSGAELYRQVSEVSDIPFILMTGYTPDLKRYSMPILEKPISLQELLQKVHEGLQGSHSKCSK